MSAPGPDRLHAAAAELRRVVELARQDLDRFRRDRGPTREELRALQEAALRGDLGQDMRELARRVEAGRDSWQAVFTGDSPRADLLRGHMELMAQRHRETIRAALVEDEEFDPLAPGLDLRG